MTEPIIILAENEECTRRLVQLEAIHQIDREGSWSELHTASLTQGGVTIRRIRSAEPPVSFYMDADVMDALCAVWTGFKDAQIAQKKAETERQAHIIDEAYALAGEHIKIEPDGVNIWRIACPVARFDSGPIFGAESLLLNVKAVHERYRHLWNRKIIRTTGGDAA